MADTSAARSSAISTSSPSPTQTGNTTRRRASNARCVRPAQPRPGDVCGKGGRHRSPRDLCLRRPTQRVTPHMII
jgi:hypothetical protein